MIPSGTPYFQDTENTAYSRLLVQALQRSVSWLFSHITSDDKSVYPIGLDACI